MTRPTVMDKDRLAAFVDGEMSPEEAAAVVMHLADNPEDQSYVDDLMAANAALAQAFASPMEEPVPTVLRNLILQPDAGYGTDNVVPLRATLRASMRLPRVGMVAGGALAAGLALAVFLPASGGLDLAPGPLAAGSPLYDVLVSQPAGEVRSLQDGATAMVLASLPTPDGFCREVEVIDTDAQSVQAALACTDGAGWTVAVVIAESLADAEAADGFGTASGDEAQSFEPFLDRVGAGASLSPEEEAAAIARGWVN